MKTLFFAYSVLLTMLLLSRDPSRFVGEEIWLLHMLDSIAHLASFLVLAVLALAPKWPLPRWTVILGLVAYGGATESLQQLVPGRTGEWADLLQNLAGIAAGAAIWWIAADIWRARSRNTDTSGRRSAHDAQNGVR